MSALPFNLSDRGSLARKLVDATLGSAGVRIAGLAVAFAVGVQLARYLGPAEYGVYGTVVAFVSILAVLSQLALPQLITREIAADSARGDMSAIKGALVWFTVVVTAASAVAVLVGLLSTTWLASRYDARFMQAYTWGLASIPLLALGNLGVSALRGFHRVISAQVYDALIRPAIFALLLAWMILSYGTLDAAQAIVLQTLATLISLALCIWQLKRCVSDDVWAAKATTDARAWVSSAVPMSGTEILRGIDGQYAVLLLGMLASLADVGVFRVALATAAFIGLPSTLINLVVMPYVASLHAEGDRKRLQQVATGSSVAMFSAALGVTAILVLWGEAAIALVFGEPYRAAWWPLVLMGVAYTVNGFFGSTATFLNMSGLERRVTLAYGVGLAIAIVLSAVLYRWYGISAASIAMICSELVKGVMMWHAGVHQMGIDTAASACIRMARPARREAAEK